MEELISKYEQERVFIEREIARYRESRSEMIKKGSNLVYIDMRLNINHGMLGALDSILIDLKVALESE